MPRDYDLHGFTSAESAEGIFLFRGGERLFNKRYQLVREIGAGGMGVVWLARDLVEGTDAALKFVPSLLVKDAAELDRLRGEVRTGKELRHARLVSTWGLEVEDGASLAAIVMEYVEGETLKEKLDRHPRGFFEPPEITGWVRDICDALTYLHGEAKRIHRDLKPANIIVGADGRARLMDFGISHRIQEMQTKLSRTGAGAAATSSTLAYASPQQVLSRPPTPADDLYSLGATLYELLTGGRVFLGNDTALLAHQITSVPVTPISARRQELVEGGIYTDPGAAIPAAWEQGVQKLLAKERHDRTPSAADVLTWTASRSTAETAAGNWHFTPSTQAPARKNSTAGAECNSAFRQAPRSRVPVVLAIIVAALGAAGWGLWKNQNPASPPPDDAAAKAESARKDRELAEAKTKAAAAEQAAAKLTELTEKNQKLADVVNKMLTAGEVRDLGAKQKRLAEEAAARALPTPATATKEKPFVNSLGMKFVPVPGTEVAFCMHETRTRDFAAFIADPNRGYTMSGDGADLWKTAEFKGVPVGRGTSGAEAAVATSTHPVVCVSWVDAGVFCEWLSKKEGLTYRLPTDREWSVAVGIGDRENAANSPEKLDETKVPDVYPWDGTFTPASISGNYADSAAGEKFGKDWGIIDRYTDGFATTAPVMSPKFRANRLGLHDMGGNVWEWVAGCYDGTDREGKNKRLTSIRALRGGSWSNDGPEALLSSGRSNYGPGTRSGRIGFRVVVVGVSGG